MLASAITTPFASMFNPKQLTSARISRGMTMKELAEKAELSRQMISNYESGKTVPKAESLLKILSVLRFPRSFFSTEIPELTTGATFFRSQSAATKKSRESIQDKVPCSSFTSGRPNSTKSSLWFFPPYVNSKNGGFF